MPLFQHSSHITIHGGTFYEVQGNFYNIASVAGLPSTLGTDEPTIDERARGQSSLSEGTSWEIPVIPRFEITLNRKHEVISVKSPNIPGLRFVVREACLRTTGVSVLVKRFEGSWQLAARAFVDELGALEDVWDPYFLQVMGRSPQGEKYPYIIYQSLGCPPTPLDGIWYHLIYKKNAGQLMNLARQLSDIVTILHGNLLDPIEPGNLAEDNLIGCIQVVPSDSCGQELRLLYLGELRVTKSQLRKTLDALGRKWLVDVDASLGSIRDFSRTAQRAANREMHERQSWQLMGHEDYPMSHLQERNSEIKKQTGTRCYYGWSSLELNQSIGRSRKTLSAIPNDKTLELLARWVQPAHVHRLPEPLDELLKVLRSMRS